MVYKSIKSDKIREICGNAKDKIDRFIISDYEAAKKFVEVCDANHIALLGWAIHSREDIISKLNAISPVIDFNLDFSKSSIYLVRHFKIAINMISNAIKLYANENKKSKFLFVGDNFERFSDFVAKQKFLNGPTFVLTDKKKSRHLL